MHAVLMFVLPDIDSWLKIVYEVDFLDPLVRGAVLKGGSQDDTLELDHIAAVEYHVQRNLIPEGHSLNDV